MKILKSTVLMAIFVLFSANTLFAGNLGDIKVVDTEDQPYVLNISLTACEDAKVLTSTLDHIFLVQLFIPSMCSDAETYMVPVEVPPCNSYKKIEIQLYGMNEKVTTSETPMFVFQDSATIEQDLEVRKNACAAQCLEEYEGCKEACGDDVTCLENCEAAYDDCLENITTEFKLSCYPRTLNMKSQGKWVTCELKGGEEGYTVCDIDPGTIQLYVGDQSMTPDWYKKGKKSLKIKFSRSELQDLILGLEEDPAFPMSVEITVAGSLTDNSPFEATDTITVKNPGHKEKGDHFRPGKRGKKHHRK